MANAAAAVAVSKKGTASVTSAELRRKILPHAFLAAEEKIVAAGGGLEAQLSEWRQSGLRVGFTNGCFDILHPGHVKVLTAARGACDRLIVGLNSDASVKRLKGEGRPVQDERARAEVLAALEAVDLVVIFEEDTPIRLITAIKPSVLVKGGDYTRDQVVGHEIVEAYGGEVLLVDVLPGFSTTSLVNRARGDRACAPWQKSRPSSCCDDDGAIRPPGRPLSMFLRSCLPYRCPGRRRWSRSLRPRCWSQWRRSWMSGPSCNR
jgi:D-beta-D-heptose 7-phosphate kinase/D-beta-D-heptose 1-phosphate adenosyltransferase